MKKLLLLLGLLALAGTAAQADERDTVKRSAEILREFRSMPERQVPRPSAQCTRSCRYACGQSGIRF